MPARATLDIRQQKVSQRGPCSLGFPVMADDCYRLLTLATLTLAPTIIRLAPDLLLFSVSQVKHSMRLCRCD